MTEQQDETIQCHDLTDLRNMMEQLDRDGYEYTVDNYTITVMEGFGMSDLISRQDVFDALDSTYFSDFDDYERAKTVIQRLPSAVPSSRLLTNITVQYPVVLCVNCKHCEFSNNEEPYCHYHSTVVTPDYFCADGEEGEWMP